MNKTELSISLLSADFSRLGDEVAMAQTAGADYIHIDVMDGRFVPNITIGPLVVSSLASMASIPFDIHLMIAEPERHVDLFVEALKGLDDKIYSDTFIVIHQEACIHLDRTLSYIKSKGPRCGVALNPSTPPGVIDYIAEMSDQILVMSVNPGFGGQSFIPSSVEKVEALRELKERNNYKYKIAIDGGISEKTAAEAARAGAEILISGSAIFNAEDPAAALRKIKEIANAHTR